MEREDLNFYLQQADPQALAELCQKVEGQFVVTMLQEPTLQTLLLPVDDPVNRGSFYAGEILVTSVIVQVDGNKGWAMVLDEAPDLARRIAILDAAFASNIEGPAIAGLVEMGRMRHAERTGNLASQVAATRVSFDLM
jgi:alpha-D-ribose 1-methylphosphonate 5-triphosphate synthase subunit PhnG